MKKVEVVKATEVKTSVLDLQRFSQENKEQFYSEKVNKKKLKKLAEKLRLEHDDEKIQFAKKLINAYLAEK